MDACLFCCVCFRFSVLSQEIGWEERLRNDLFCVEWDVKPQLTQSLISWWIINDDVLWYVVVRGWSLFFSVPFIALSIGRSHPAAELLDPKTFFFRGRRQVVIIW